MATPASHATQQTLKSAVALSGHGLFAGAPVTATLRPASAGSGIVFRRSDLPGTPDIPASIDYVIDRPRRTSLRRGEASVEMVEHCLSALSGLGVDNAVIDVNAPELPAGDGSASNFVDAIRSVGTVPQQSAREPLVVREPITVRDGEAMVTALPADGEDSEFLYVLDYGPTSPIARQVHSFTLSPVAYAEQIAPARTFSTLDEARAMWNQGFFKHLTAKEMLVIGDQGPVDNAYRLQDEPVRHKLLDMVGDLALVGRPLVGRFVAVRSGHALNHRLARELVTRIKPAGDEARTVSPVEPALDIQSILGILPHRYPMVLVDRVLEIEHGRRAVGVKNVTFNEQFFQGHYPNAPIMPGVLVIEAMCQLAGLMLHQCIEHKDRIALLLSLDNVRWRKPVTPGDQLILEAESLRCTSRLGEVQCRALVGGELVAEALAKFMVVDAKARM